MKPIMTQYSFPRLLQDFFCNRLIHQRNVSKQTISSYRDTFRLLLKFAQNRLGRPPVKFQLSDFDVSLVLAFLDYLEKDRGNNIRSRNVRLAAIRSFFKYAALQEPTELTTIQGVLAIPFKRFDTPVLDYLSRQEVEALLAAPNELTWCGQRDRIMLETFYNTGARISEIAALNAGDLSLQHSSSILIHGKGRKNRTVPLWKSTSTHIAKWLKQIPAESTHPLFPSRRGTRLTRSGIAARIYNHVETASLQCESLTKKRVSPHTLRHTTAMHLLQSGVDIAVIALWLGHESPSTTHIYVEADLAMKKRALDKVKQPTVKSPIFKPGDSLLQFLDRL